MAGTTGLVISEYSSRWPTFKYKFPFTFSISNNIALRYRTDSVITYIFCSTFPIIEKWYDFLQFRDQTLRALKVSPTTIILEGFLRDTFNRDDIFIINKPMSALPTYLYNRGERGTVNSQTYLYNKSENPTEPNKTYLYNKKEIYGAFNFIVQVPSELIAQGITIQQIRALIDPYVNLGVIYDVVLV